MTTTSKILTVFPQKRSDFYKKYAPFIHTVARLNITTNEDILSDIYLLYATGKLTQSELAKLYKIRKLNGIWQAEDPICGHATSLTELGEQGFDVADEREKYEDEPQFELPVGVITSTRELAAKLHVTMRRAQQLVAAQVVDLQSGYDLFGMEV